ncbi:MAG TPA: GTPase Era, partial [Anaerolineales bacterium]|nr:GTPase Era [Anaerolineales bacterium]
GFIAILGKPNVGKSTLVNAILGQKIAAVSPRPQTTRRRQLGILTQPEAQLIFVDTPGVHAPKHKLGQFFNQEAEEALDGVDVVLFLVDASLEPDDEDRQAASLLQGLRRKPEVILGLNKIDKLPAQAIDLVKSDYQVLAPDAAVLAFSATSRQGLKELLEAITARLPVRPPEYPEDQITDLYEKEIAAELIREAALVFLRDEVPHALAVRMDEFSERENGNAFISATLLVERDSQKGIVIGEKGAMLKKIGTAARKEIESMSGRKVFLELRVKVDKDWRDDENALRRLGYKVKGRK